MKIAPHLFRFVWFRCPDGYAIEPAAPPSLSGPRGLLEKEAGPSVPRLVANSGQLVQYAPDDDAPDIHYRLCNTAPTAEGALSFTNDFGTLYRQTIDDFEADQTMDLPRFLEFRDAVRVALGVCTGGPSADVFNKTFPRTRFSVLVDPRPSVPVMAVVPHDLANFIVFRVATEISSGIEWRQCPVCGEDFPIAQGRGAVSKKGVGTTRKVTCGRAACQRALQRRRKKEVTKAT